uniref:Uncharacterized protein n=1 Tax=Amphimedon queenslandica TaxID=400682 RepID=I1FVU7_AMPQE
MIPLVDYRGIK